MEAVASEGYKFLALLFFVDKASCVVMLETQLFLKLAQAVARPYLRGHILTILQNLCFSLNVLTDFNAHEK